MKIKNRNILYKGYYQLEELELETRKGYRIQRELFMNKNGVCAIVYNRSTDKYIFVNQWRPSIEEYILEVVAGSIEKGESPIDAIKKEVIEETGYKPSTIKYIRNFYVSPGAITENVNLFFVEVETKISDELGAEGEHEDIELIEMSLEEVIDYHFIDAKTIIATHNINKK
jgi:ADP-ribose pyrophosphatase